MVLLVAMVISRESDKSRIRKSRKFDHYKTKMTSSQLLITHYQKKKNAKMFHLFTCR